MQKKLYLFLVLFIVLYGVWMAVGKPESKNTENTTAPKTAAVKVLLTGDINLGRLTGQKILDGDIIYPFAYISEEVKKYDLAFGNLESQLADLNGETQSPTNEYRFAGPPAGAESLRLAGFDIISTANNHMWDYGKDALFETMDNLTKAGVKYVGSSKETATLYQPLITEVNGQKIAWLATTLILNGYEKAGADQYVAMADMDKLIPAVEAAKSQADWVIVSLHGGIEYRSVPTKEQTDIAHQLVDAGANIVVGHHPHIMEGVEKYKNGLIFYSLGNFAFWQPFGYWTEHSFMAEIELKPNGELNYNPVAIDSGWQPKLAAGEDAVKILQHLAELSSKLNIPPDGISSN